MKRQIVDLSLGVNVIGDRSIIKDGFSLMLDGADLRSGSPRNFPGHKKIKEVEDANYIFEHYGITEQSKIWKDHCAYRTLGKEIVISSAIGQAPEMMIHQVKTNLSITPPNVAPYIETSNDMMPALSVEVVPGSGTLQPGTRSYRMSVESDKGITSPSPVVYARISAAGSAVKIRWNKIETAMRYHLFAGDGGNEARVAILGENTLEHTDDGTSSGDNVAASNYDTKGEAQYVYTFERMFGGFIDESGPSPVSKPISTSTGRVIKFNTDMDGAMEVSEDLDTSLLTFAYREYAFPYNNIFAIHNNIEAFNFHYEDSKNITFQIRKKSPTSIDYVPDVMNMFKNMIHTNFYIEMKMVAATSYPDLIRADRFSYVNGNTIRYTAAAIHSVSSGPYVESSPIRFVNFWHFLYPKSGLQIKTGDIMKINYTQDNGVITVCSGYITSSVDYEDSILFSILSIPYIFTNTQPITINSLTITGERYGNYIRYRNLYRTTAAGAFQLVDKIPLYQTEYYDSMPDYNLEGIPSTYYQEDGIDVIGAPAPLGIRKIISHHGMWFGIHGRTVRWTPIGMPGIWPEAFYNDGFSGEIMDIQSYAGALIVLCTDGVYRLDGNSPTRISLQGTHAVDGCYAPRATAVTTEAGLLYVSKRGVIAFDGMHGRCITDNKIPTEFFTRNSYLNSSSDRMIIPTMDSFNYSQFVNNDGMVSTAEELFRNKDINPPEGPNYNLMSFVYDGRYFLYWNDADNKYQAHTVLCIDLKGEGLPITTLPLKLEHVHVSTDKQVLALVDSRYKTIQGGLKDINYDEISLMNDIDILDKENDTGVTVKREIVRLFADGNTHIPMHCRTTIGDASSLKTFESVEFFGRRQEGTFRVRIYIDGRYVCDSKVTMSLQPSRHNRVNIPIRRQRGYSMDIEFAGVAEIRSIVVNYEEEE